MHRIDTPAAVNERFVDKNPVTGTPGTIVDDDWLNAVQESIARVIEGGGETLTKGDDNQLLNSLAPHVNGNAKLRTLTPVAGRHVYRKYHTTDGDGGALSFRAVTGAAPGTYVDNNGTIIVPTGGDGSVAWEAEFEGAVKVKWFGAKGDGITDDTDAIQSAMNCGFEVRLGTGIFMISSPLEIGVGEQPIIASLIGEEETKPFDAVIETLPGFTGFSMVRNWSEDWYSGPGESRDGPPADLTAQSSPHLFSRYVNIRGIRFRVNGTQSNRITPIDLVSQQEGSEITKCVFLGDTALKGYPIRITSTSTGTEISQNVLKLNRHICYDGGWLGQYKITGAGHGVQMDYITTTNSEVDESPFQIETIDLSISRMNCEAFAAGLPTFDLTSRGVSIDKSFVSIRNLQGDVFKITRPVGASSFFVPPSIRDVMIFPEDSNWANITNLSSINLIVDQTNTNVIYARTQPIVGENLGNISRIVDYSYDRLTVSDGVKTITKTTEGMFVPVDTSWNSGNNLSIPYELSQYNHGAVVTVTGRNASNDLPFLLRVWVGVSDNSGGSIQQSYAVLDNQNALGTISATFNTDRYELVTNSVTEMQRCQINITEPTRFESLRI